MPVSALFTSSANVPRVFAVCRARRRVSSTQGQRHGVQGGKADGQRAGVGLRDECFSGGSRGPEG